MLAKAMDNKWCATAGALACCLLLIAAQRCEAQGNLVPNPSFEVLEDSCPQGCCFNPGQRPLHWYTWQNSSDYFNACAEGGWLDSLSDVPQNGFAFQYAYDGDAYVGVYSFQSWDDYREYIGAELLSPLVEGTTYEVSLRVNAALGGNYFAPTGACNNVGLLFTMESNAWLGITGAEFGYRNYAHMYSPTVVSDTAGWTLITGSFTADSAYNHVVLGNFFENNLTDTQLLVSGATYVQAYYLIDAVCVSADGEGCEHVGWDEAEHDHGLKVWMDRGSTNVILSWLSHHTFRFEVTDAAGRLLYTGMVLGGMGTMGVEGLASGIYMVTAFSDGERISSKFVLDR